MNAIRCPQCGAVNLLSANECIQCRFSFVSLPPTAYISVSAEEIYQSQNPNFAPPAQDNETGRKTFFWYRVYCAAMVMINLLVAALGAGLVAFRPETNRHSDEEVLIAGIVYAVFGILFAIVYAVTLFLPRKSWNWVVGIVMIALGLTSCCFVPFLVPLLIYWIKPETKAYFGRN